MPTTRPGFIWSGTEWVAIGQEAVLAPVAYQATAPTSPATGDIWIDSDDDVPSIDSSVFFRWTRTATAGQTTLSGVDDSGLALKYTVGYEELYINGVLQVRASDYVATTGNTITGLLALSAGDIVTIMSQVAYAVGDTYTQTAADSKFQTQISADVKFQTKVANGLNLVVPTSASGGTVGANGAVTFSGVSSFTVNGCFNSTYENYKIFFTVDSGTANSEVLMQLSAAGTANGANYIRAGSGGSATSTSANFALTFVTGSGNGSCEFSLLRPAISAHTTCYTNWTYDDGGTFLYTMIGGRHRAAASFDGIRIFNVSSMTGTIRIYGYNNGA